MEKHARATHVIVRVSRRGEGGFSLEVLDNGVGLPAHAKKAKHFGLGIMKERAQAIGATIRIEGLEAPEHGTRIFLERPDNQDR